MKRESGEREICEKKDYYKIKNKNKKEGRREKIFVPKKRGQKGDTTSA